MIYFTTLEFTNSPSDLLTQKQHTWGHLYQLTLVRYIWERSSISGQPRNPSPCASRKIYIGYPSSDPTPVPVHPGPSAKGIIDHPKERRRSRYINLRCHLQFQHNLLQTNLQSPSWFSTLEMVNRLQDCLCNHILKVS